MHMKFFWNPGWKSKSEGTDSTFIVGFHLTVSNIRSSILYITHELKWVGEDPGSIYGYRQYMFELFFLWKYKIWDNSGTLWLPRFILYLCTFHFYIFHIKIRVSIYYYCRQNGFIPCILYIVDGLINWSIYIQ